MKTAQFIEALQAADKLFQSRYEKPMEIFDFHWNEDEVENDMLIEASANVIYENDEFGFGSKRGFNPSAKIAIHFECEDGKIDDRSLRFVD